LTKPFTTFSAKARGFENKNSVTSAKGCNLTSTPERRTPVRLSRGIYPDGADQEIGVPFLPCPLGDGAMLRIRRNRVAAWAESRTSRLFKIGGTLLQLRFASARPARRCYAKPPVFLIFHFPFLI
jgi:hypothetical protein